MRTRECASITKLGLMSAVKKVLEAKKKERG